MIDVIPCPHCGKKLRYQGADPPEHVRCPSCGNTFGSRVDELNPVEGTYETVPAETKIRRQGKRRCTVCDTVMRADATFCDVCGTLDEQVDTPEMKDRRRRKQQRELDDVKFRRLDLIAAQVGIALLALGCTGCGYFPIGLVLSVALTTTLAVWVHRFGDSPPEDADARTRRRWKGEKAALKTQFFISTAVSAVMIALSIVIFIKLLL